MIERPGRGERAVLVAVGIGRAVDAADVAEFKALAASAGTECVGVVLAMRPRPDPRFFVGSGKAEEIKACAQAAGADLVLVDRTLTPSQERNLEKLTDRRVLDRNGLILDIFAQRARSFEGKLQVELAQLTHLSTRLVRGWTHLERQKGGIGLRGPGETQLETDRRLIGRRIRTLRARLDKLALQRDTGRRVRRDVPVPTVALVGYTNAGKSTLFNALTGSSIYVADQLFATLDPTVRRLRLDGIGEVVLADTVGFIRELPHELVAAFRSTLLEAQESELLLHVVDAADPQRGERVGQVREVLRGIGAGEAPELLVFNKIDASGEDARVATGANGLPAQAWCSAATGAGLDGLRAAIARAVRPNLVRRTLHVPLAAAALRSELYRRHAIREERWRDDGSWEIDVELEAQEVAALAGGSGALLLDAQPGAAPPTGQTKRVA
ncbi:MAG TPA: ribosome rescue GTPase HflX [Steroidobacteraceae bacterium]|nr:ribosome rescue GTPase HflX [Steroidobacteraceae bacterium]